MKYIGLDLGNRTCGVAVSDSLGLVATGLTTIRFFDKDLDTCLSELIKISDEKKNDKFVLGYPLSMDGSISPQTEYVLKFKEMLVQACPTKEVILMDERLSTMEVQKVMISADVSRGNRKKVVDMLSAVLILQSYLDMNQLTVPQLAEKIGVSETMMAKVMEGTLPVSDFSGFSLTINMLLQIG